MKSAAWRMHWRKSGNDDAGGEKSPPFPAGPRTEQKDVAAGSALPGHAGHGLVGFQLCGLSVVCGLCRASILAGLAGMQGRKGSRSLTHTADGSWRVRPRNLSG